jgi:hypothetical protein
MLIDRIQRLGIPAYFYPDQTYWPQLQSGAPTVGLAIADPADGPGVEPDPRYVAAMRETRGRGIGVLGYVTTSYGRRVLADVRSDVARWHAWYSIDGIFFDEVTTNRSGIMYCRTLCQHVKRQMGSDHLVVLNPGTQTLEGFMGACDILLNSESTWRTYRDAYVGNASWVANYPASRFWHVVHGCPTEAEMRMAMRLAQTRHAGWIYVTDGTGANPYQSLPSGRYWRNQLRYAAQYAE